MKILIIEDEPELVKSITKYLVSESYLCEIATNLKEASEKVWLHDYDCILLDVALPDGSGFDILNMLRERNKLEGVIIISAKNSIDDRIKGLKLGADDYLTKPFHLAELSARIAAVIRRRNFSGANEIRYHEILVDLSGMEVKVNNKTVELTRKEFDLLVFLFSNKGRVVSKHAIAEHLSGDEADFHSGYDFIYAHMKNLKRKLTDAGCPDYIKTIYGVGYKFEP